MAPLDLKADSVCDRELLFDTLSIADWILPAVYVGHIKKVIWIKPPWSEQIEDKAIFLHVGRYKKDGTIRLVWYMRVGRTKAEKQVGKFQLYMRQRT